MTKDKEGPYVRPPQMLAEILRALLTFREKLAAQLLTLSIDLAPPHVPPQVREVLLCLCMHVQGIVEGRRSAFVVNTIIHVTMCLPANNAKWDRA